MPRPSDEEVDEAADEEVERIDAHTFSGTDVPRETTISFLQGIISKLELRISGIREDIRSIPDGPDMPFDDD